MRTGTVVPDIASSNEISTVGLEVGAALRPLLALPRAASGVAEPAQQVADVEVGGLVPHAARPAEPARPPAPPAPGAPWPYPAAPISRTRS